MQSLSGGKEGRDHVCAHVWAHCACVRVHACLTSCMCGTLTSQYSVHEGRGWYEHLRSRAKEVVVGDCRAAYSRQCCNLVVGPALQQLRTRGHRE